ncbi:MAG: NF038122 family metalloprotease [Armatimonadetes bacterium]|nr:NF038122 family metalloprotease [Armatimonadota bacterium]
MSKIFKIASLAIATCMAGSALSLQINFTYRPDLDAKVVQDFQMAANIWEGYFTNDVSVNINIDYINYGAGFLGAASDNIGVYSYSSVKGGLAANANTTAAQTAVNHLQPGNSLNFWINHTAENGDSGTPYFDNNNSTNNQNVQVTNANAKALGLMDAHAGGQDAYISFNSFYDNIFAFHRQGFIDPVVGVDFVSVCEHEIGHAMGFYSGVDDVDEVEGYGEDNYFASVLDLFRKSRNAAGGLDMDMSADNREKYFSIDGQNTLAQFSRGVVYGDGWQASHWQHFNDAASRYGIMDPRALRGAFYHETPLDVEALNVIGWQTAVPEPTSMAVLGLGVIALIKRRKK